MDDEGDGHLLLLQRLALAEQYRPGFLPLAFHFVDERGLPDPDRAGQRHEMAETHMLH
jgi:hypothetical protein